MKSKILIIFIFSLLFSPILVWAFSSSDAILVSIFAKKNEAVEWSKNIAMVPGENFDFLLIVKNNSAEPLKNVNLEIEIPKEISYNGYLTINGKTKKEKIKKPIALGVLLPYEQKTIEFQAKSQNLNFNEEKREVSAKIFAGNFASLDSLQIILKPYTFQGIKIERKTLLPTVSASTKNWYFLIIVIILLAVLFLRIFLKLFSTPMG